MARSTCNPNRQPPKGMMHFEVIRSTVRDSVGQYCVPGDMAILDKKTAQAYHNRNFIRPKLPDFDMGDADDADDQEEGSPDPVNVLPKATASDGGKTETSPSPRPVERVAGDRSNRRRRKPTG